MTYTIQGKHRKEVAHALAKLAERVLLTEGVDEAGKAAPPQLIFA